MSVKFNRLSLTLKLVRVEITSIIIFVAAIFITGFSGISVAQTSEDSAAVLKQFEDYIHTFNTHDPVALSKFFTEDADFMMGNLPKVHGRQPIENWWWSYFEKQEPGRKGTFILKSFRFITADVALANIETRTGGRDTVGAALNTRKARGTWVLHRQNDNWLISAIRGMPTEKDSVILVPSLATAKSLQPHIRAFVDSYEDAYDSHNPSMISAFFRNDADIIVRNGPLLQGKRAIQNWWRGFFSTPRPYKVILIIDEIKIISNDVVQLNIIATGAVPKIDDESQPIRDARATWILVRESGKWLIAALRVMPSENDRIIRR